MGQATVDLPDATQVPAPAPLNSADDLLAQLAGQEIDRLLADAEESAPHSENVTTDKAADKEEYVPATEAEVDELLKTADEEARQVAAEVAAAVSGSATPATADAAPAPEKRTDEYAAQVDALFKELNADPAPKHPTEPAPAAPAAPAEQQTTADERAALTAPIVAEKPSEPQSEFAALVEGKPSLLVRLLEIVNAPFSACPDVLRETLGKIAILTLMNSLGVLLYLILFRR